MKWTTLNRTAPPQGAPVTVAEAKQFLRVDEAFTADDELLERCIATATTAVETMLNRALVEQTWVLTIECFPLSTCAIELPKPPAVSVVSIVYVDTAGVTQTLDPAAYTLAADDWAASIREAYGRTWPSTRSQPDAVSVTFVAGYPKDGTDYGANVPDTFKTAICMHVQGQYDNLKAEDAAALERAIAAMLSPHRVGRI